MQREVAMTGASHDGSHSSSWVCTILTQVALCVAMYVAFHMAAPLKYNQEYKSGAVVSDGGARDFIFLSVCGGRMPREQQTHLLELMDRVAKAYKVQFVVNVSELGEDDPLIENGTLNFQSLRVPWYATISSEKQGMGYFLKRVSVLNHRTLDIIGLDTGSLHDFFHRENTSDIKNDQLNWLMRTLAASDSEWRIAVGIHPLIACEEAENETVTRKVYQSLDQIFLRYQVNAYVSKQGCRGHYTKHRGIAYIGNPNHVSENHRSSLPDGNSILLGEVHNGFLLHRVSSLEFASYFINSAGKVIFKSTLRQRGMDVM